MLIICQKPRLRPSANQRIISKPFMIVYITVICPAVPHYYTPAYTRQWLTHEWACKLCILDYIKSSQEVFKFKFGLMYQVHQDSTMTFFNQIGIFMLRSILNQCIGQSNGCQVFWAHNELVSQYTHLVMPNSSDWTVNMNYS